MATILIADDQPMNRRYLITLLGYFKHRLLEASNAAEALLLAKSEHPSLVISHLPMPIFDGQELAVRMHSDPELLTIPILFYSSTYSLEQARAVARKVGALDVLPKPGDPETVLAMIYRALGLPCPPVREVQPAGVFDVFEPIPRDFARELAELEIIARRLGVLVEMSLELAAEPDPSKLLFGLARMARELVGAAYSAVGLVDENGCTTRVILSSDLGTPADRDSATTPAPDSEPLTYVSPPSDSILGGLMSHARTVRLRDVSIEQLPFQIPGCAHVDSLLAVPLLSGSSPRGWLLVANKHVSVEFTGGDVLVVTALATQGVSTYEKVERRLIGEVNLAKSKAMYEALFEAAPDAMLAVDPEGTIKSANAQTGRMFGYSQSELAGQPIEKLMPDRFRDRHPRLRQGYDHEPHLRPMGSGLNLYGKRKDGSEFPVDIMLSPLETSEGRLVLSVIRDITGLRENETRILDLNRQLHTRVEELQTANQSLETFSYSVSHDLRAPLRAIDGFARVLSEDYRTLLDEDANRLLDVIAGNCHKMGAIIEDLLAFSRAGRRDVLRSQIDMTELVQSVVEEFRALEPSRRIKLIEQTLPPALGDRALVRQAFTNLIGNAWKFTRNTPGATIEIGTYRNSEVNVYFVKDNGAGFDPAYSHKLFGVFERLHREDQFEGTGIGLALVHRIIQSHGGKVWATGKVGEGATFYFTLERIAADDKLDMEPAAVRY
jgi:PAS domain S-box-containing protein